MGFPIEFDQYISPDGEVYKFNNNIDQFVLPPSFSGYGLPQITYRTQRGPFQDGVTPLGFVLNPRIVLLVHRRNGRDRDDFWNNRSDLLDKIRPNRQTINSFQTGTLRKILPNGSRRDLNVFINSVLEISTSSRNRWDEWSFQVPVQFIAHDPLFFNPTEASITASLSSGTELTFSITFDNSGIVFGTDALNFSSTINYIGTYKTFPTIVITGPIDNPLIQNITTQEKIELNKNLSLGEVVTITLGTGNKTVTDAVGNNLIGSLSTDSDLVSFHIAPDPEAEDGMNIINVGGANAQAGVTSVVISYNDKYIGI